LKLTTKQSKIKKLKLNNNLSYSYLLADHEYKLAIPLPLRTLRRLMKSERDKKKQNLPLNLRKGEKKRLFDE